MSTKTKEDKPSNPAHRPPLWGYGTQSFKRTVSLTLPSPVMAWVLKHHPKISEYIRKLIVGDCLKHGGIKDAHSKN